MTKNSLLPLKNIKSSLSKKTRFIAEQLIKNSSKIDMALSVSHTLVNFAFYKTPFALIEGAFKLINESIKSTYGNPRQWMTAEGDWKEFNLGFKCDKIIGPILEKFENRPIISKSEHIKTYLYETPIGQLGVVHDYYTFFYSKNQDLKLDDILNFLSETKLHQIDSILFSLKEKADGDEGDPDPSGIAPEEILDKPSETASFYTTRIRKFINANISRGVLFYGPPGTGKTTIAYTLIKELNLKTLKCTLSYSNLEKIKFVIKLLKVEAIILDDFDHAKVNEHTLAFLEFAKRNTKLIIALANNTERFYPAILRPGRFDEVIPIACLDENTVKNSLGSLSALFFNRVKSWPIAFINELVHRHNVLPDENIEEAFEELSGRVESQEDFSFMKKIQKERGKAKIARKIKEGKLKKASEKQPEISINELEVIERISSSKKEDDEILKIIESI